MSDFMDITLSSIFVRFKKLWNFNCKLSTIHLAISPSNKKVTERAFLGWFSDFNRFDFKQESDTET